jgi:D-alanyl-D-alanine carboxypeptidase
VVSRLFRHRSASATTALLLALSLFVSACSTTETLSPAPDPVPLPEKYAAIVVDGGGRTLYAVNSEELRYPASLTKMMTLYMLFEALQSGKLSTSSQLSVSAYAASRPPSKLGVKAGDSIAIDTAIRALAVKSANDVATVVAENLSGSEEAFGRAMTAKAREIGMSRTTFRNASGLPDSAQVTTAKDMAVLSLRLRQRFPQYYSYFSLREFTVDGKTVRGHNRALDMIEGADGIKTGYTRASGFNLATSVRHRGKTIVGVVLGEDSSRQRDERMARLIRTYISRAQ